MNSTIGFAPNLRQLFSLTLLVVTVFIAPHGTSQTPQAAAPNVENNKSVMRKLYEQDQKDFDNSDRAKIRKHVQRLMSEGKIQSAEDYYYAAFIFQHGLKSSDYLYAHVLAVTAVNKGLHNAMWLSAATLDRYLQSVQQAQIFGTQFGSLFNDRDDQEPYDREMVSDEIRAMWCVTTKSAQARILADKRAGKGFGSSRSCLLPDAQFDKN
jgi:hypothetical protein